MSSNIRITRICEQCGKEFEARTTITKTCSDICAKRAYKARQRSAKVEASEQQVKQIKAKPIEDLRQHDYLTIEESAKLMRISRRTLYRMNGRGELLFTKLGRRVVIQRADIDKLFERPVKPVTEQQPSPVPLADCYALSDIKQKYGISDKALHELVKRNGINKQHNGKNTYVPKGQIDQLLNPTTIQL